VLKLTPEGSVPARESVGAGTPVAVTVKGAAAVFTVNVTVLALVKTGNVEGVTLAEPDAGPVPTALVAVTVQPYVVPFARPVTVMGDWAAEALKGPPGVQVAV
jgi:hypothetical protein